MTPRTLSWIMASLIATFRRLNRRYFGNRLPFTARRLTLKWARMAEMGNYSNNGKRVTIEINTILRRWPTCMEATLLHEMAHFATAGERADHGPKWLRERRRLYRAGAFESLL
jgi:hypothetical protein